MDFAKNATSEDLTKYADSAFIERMKKGNYADVLGVLDKLGHYTVRNLMLIPLNVTNFKLHISIKTK